jgi:three-Cys-motif partner protein
MNSANDNYWDSYDGLQFAKHNLLKIYLGGWFPILSSWKVRVDYIDCHAGRGKHKTGEEGSPIIALKVLLNHPAKEKILKNTDVHFTFLEINNNNIEVLKNQIKELGKIPENIHVNYIESDYEEHLSKLLLEKQSIKGIFPPTFAFIDPFNFSISMDLVNKLLSFPTTEVLITFMFRNIDLAMTRESQQSNLNKLFGTNKWEELRTIENYKKRIEATINLFSNQLKANYVTHMKMLARNNALKYVEIHATNHPKGKDLIKDSIWKVCPDGVFTASERRTPDQLILLEPEPNLSPLEENLRQEFSGKSVSIKELYNWLLNQIYLKKHLHQIIRKLRNNGSIRVTGYTGRFSFNNNPIIHFPNNL